MALRPVPETFLVAFSLAGENAELVRSIAEHVEEQLGRGAVFYYEWYAHYIAGDDADLKLQAIYTRSELVVLCISGSYGGKPWPLAEHRAIRSRSLQIDERTGKSESERVLPLRVADGDIPGLLLNTITVDARQRPPSETANVIVARLALIRSDSPNVGNEDPHDERSGEEQVKSAWRSASNLPPRNNQFVGREKELRAIHRSLNRKYRYGVTRELVIHGHGGVGKTALALEYAWSHASDYPGGVFFVDCGFDHRPQLEAFATKREAEATGPEPLVTRVKHRLESGPASLLILDGVPDVRQWNSDALQRDLPTGACRRLITTLDHRVWNIEQIFPGRLSKAQGVALLSTYRRDASTDVNRSAAARIVDGCEGFPLALIIIGIYMSRNPSVSWTRYAADLLVKGFGPFAATEHAVADIAAYEKSIEVVFADLLSTLASAERRAIEYVAVLQRVYPEWLILLLEHDADIIVEPSPGFDGPGDAVLARLAEQQLLIRRSDSVDAVSLHAVLGRFLSDRLESEARAETLRQRIKQVAEEMGGSLDQRFGHVTWFNAGKGFGFINVRNLGDVFVHISAVERAGLRTLTEGQRLFFEHDNDRGKTFASNLQPAT